MGLTKKTRILVEDVKKIGNGPVVADPATSEALNQRKSVDDTLATGVLELNQNLGSTELAQAMAQTTQLANISGTGGLAIVATIEVPKERNTEGTSCMYSLVVEVINTTGGPLNVVDLSIGIGDAISNFVPVITFPTTSLLAGVTEVFKMDGQSVKNTDTRLSAVLASGSNTGTPAAAVTAPAPGSPVTVPAATAPIDWSLRIDLDTGVNIVGPGFFKVETIPGSIV